MPPLVEDQLISAAAESDPDALRAYRRPDERDGPHASAARSSKVGKLKAAGINPI